MREGQPGQRRAPSVTHGRAGPRGRPRCGRCTRCPRRSGPFLRRCGKVLRLPARRGLPRALPRLPGSETKPLESADPRCRVFLPTQHLMAAAINNQPPSKPPGPSCKWASMAADLQLGERRESRARTYAAELGAASLPRSVRGALCRGSPGSQPLMNAFLAGLAQISLFRWMCPCARFAPTPLRARSASHAHGSALQHRELRACCRDVRRWGAGCGAGKPSQGRKQGAASAGDPPKPQARWADEGKNNLPRGPGRTGCGRSAWHPPTRLCAPPAFIFFSFPVTHFCQAAAFP